MAYPLQTEPPCTTAPAAVVSSDLASASSAGPLRPRLDGVDFLRGLVMLIMVLDHARDFFGASSMNPRDVDDTALFLTRWITHFCAPIFVFLAGISAFLYQSRARTTREVARFLFTRGLWMILIEVTLVRLGWTFNLSYDFVFLQVIWVIGCAMVTLACLVFLPRWAIATFSLAVILGHNLLDPIVATEFGSFGWLWMLVHSTGVMQPAPDIDVLVIYPLVPWIAVMAAGYVLGPVLLWSEARRRHTLRTLGLAITIGFVVLRTTNLYGDPAAWSVQKDILATVLSFINCEKYPPSLLYLAMTIGPGLLVLARFRSASATLTRAVLTIGRVPFLFYVAHIFLLHAMAVAMAWLLFGEATWLFERMPVFAKPDGYGLPLAAIYFLWIATVALLHPLCRRFGEIKQRRRDWWLSYL